MQRWLGISLRRPRLILTLIGIVTVALGYFAAQIRVDSAIENLLPSDDPDRAYYETVRRVFGSEEATVIGVFDDVFAPATLAMIDRLSAGLGRLDGVREVISVTTVKGAETDEFGLRIGPLMRELPRTDEDAERLKAKIMRDPLYVGSLVAPDARATAVLVLFEPLSDAEFIARNLEGQVRDAVAAEGGGDRFAITGVQTLKVNGARLMEEDLATFVPLSLLLVLIVLIFEFRTVRGILLPLASVVVGTVWTTGVMVLAGSAINMGTLILPPLLMAIGIAYAIHVVSRYYTELRPGRPRAEVVTATLEHIRLPVAVAWLTTWPAARR
jgi:predicted RND superfamily exporter protein